MRITRRLGAACALSCLALGVTVTSASADLLPPEVTATLPTAGTFLFVEDPSAGPVLLTSFAGTPRAAGSDDGQMLELGFATADGEYALGFSTASGGTLADGTAWPDVGAFSGGGPGFSYQPPGLPCWSPSSSYEVRRVVRDAGGDVRVFEADFVTFCGGSLSGVRGRVRLEAGPDLTGPSLTLPAGYAFVSADPVWVSYDYDIAVRDDRDLSPDVRCAPESGTMFPVGTTTVSCTAVDRAGNTTDGTFRVIVQPPLELTVSLGGSGTVRARTGVATVRGTVGCSAVTDVSVDVTLRQVVARRAAVVGFGNAVVACSPPSVAYAVQVSGANGRFTPGSARASANAFGCSQLTGCAGAGAPERVLRLTGP